MQAGDLLLFVNARPFEPFRLYVADGRKLDVMHPEMVTVGEHALTLWAFYANGKVEAIDGDVITGLRTLGAVDPSSFVPTPPPEEG